jgi:hypothetical protein
LSETSPSAVDSGRQKLALEAFTRLSKAITTSTAMADGVQLDAMCNDAHRAISNFLGQHGPLTILFGDASRVEGAPIDGATIVEPIARQGVGRLTFEPGLTTDDTRTLVMAWADALDDDELSASSLLTRIWEAQVGSVEGEMRDGPPEAHVNRMVQRILAPQPVVDPLKLKTLTNPDLRGQLEFVNGLSRRTIAQLEPRLAPDYLAMSAEEAAELVVTALTRDSDYAARAALAIVGSADFATRTEFQTLTALLGTAVDDLLAQDALHEAARLVETVRQSVREDRSAGPKAELLGSLARVLESDEFMDKLVSMFENPDRSAAALTLVESMQRTAVGSLLARLPRIRTPGTRRQLSDAIKARVPETDVLCAAVKKGDVGGLAEILHIVEERADDVKRAVRIAALEHTNVQVQAAVVEAIPVSETADLGRWLYPLVANRDATLRKTVRDRAIAAKDSAAVQALMQSLDSPSVDKSEFRTIVSAIGSIGGARAADVLRRLADQSKDNEVKVVAIQAIGYTGDLGVVPWLEGHATKLLIWPAIKTAAKEAIKRIEKHQQRGPDSEDVSTVEDMRTEPITRRMQGPATIAPGTAPQDADPKKADDASKTPSMSRTPATGQTDPASRVPDARTASKSSATTRRIEERRPASMLRGPDERRTKDSPSRTGEVRRTKDSPSRMPEERRTKDSPSRMPEERRTKDSPSRMPEERRTKDSPSRMPEERREPASLDKTVPIRRPTESQSKLTEPPSRPTETRAIGPRKVLPTVRKRPPLSDDAPKIAGMPDFDLMFKNYVHFAADDEHVFARLYVDKLLDVHRFKAASTDEAYSEFFQAKIKEGFLPLASSQEALKGGEQLEELDWNVLASTYAKLMGKG